MEELRPERARPRLASCCWQAATKRGVVFQVMQLMAHQHHRASTTQHHPPTTSTRRRTVPSQPASYPAPQVLRRAQGS